MKPVQITAVIIFAFCLSLAGCKDNTGGQEPSMEELAGSAKASSQYGNLPGATNYSPQSVGNSFTGDPQTTRTITWQSRSDTGRAIINDVVYPATTKAANDIIDNDTATGNGRFYYHRVDVTDFEPGADYEYIVGATVSGNNWYSPIYNFTTKDLSDMESFYIIHVTDSQVGTSKSAATDAAVWKRVIDTALKEYDDPAFIVHTGDIVDGNKETLVPYHFDYAQETLAKHAFVYSFGNNDGSTEGKGEWYNRYAATPANITSDFDYSFDYGFVHFVNVHNSSGDNGKNLTTARNNWLNNDLTANADKAWRVAMTHQGDHSRSSNSTNTTTAFQNRNVELVMMGHNHAYFRTYPIDTNGNTKPKGEGTVWCAPNHAGTKENDASDKSYMEKDAQPNLPMFSVYTFTQGNINLKAYTVSTSGVATLYDEYDWR